MNDLLISAEAETRSCCPGFFLGCCLAATFNFGKAVICFNWTVHHRPQVWKLHPFSFSFLLPVFRFVSKISCSLVLAFLKYLWSFILKYRCIVLWKCSSKCYHLTQFLFLVHSCHVDSTSSWKFLIPIPCASDVAFDLYSQVPLNLCLVLYSDLKNWKSQDIYLNAFV